MAGHPRTDRTHLARRLCEIAREFHRRGWCLGTSGNFSATLSTDPRLLLITASGRDKAALTERDLLVVGRDSERLDGSADSEPSAETKIHGAIVSATGAGSVLHTHSPAATLLGERFVEGGGFTITGYEMLKGLAGVETHEARVFVPVLPNSQDMTAFADEVRSLFEQQPGLRAFLIAGHGLYTWGATVEDARRHVEILEFLLECLQRRTRLEPFEG